MITLLIVLLVLAAILCIAWTVYRQDQLDELQEELEKTSVYLDERANRIATEEQELRNWQTTLKETIRDTERECAREKETTDSGWISVKDRLPNPGEWVLACVDQYECAQCLTLAIYYDDAKVWHTDIWEDGEPEIYNPDYWMPIPNKIKEKKK